MPAPRRYRSYARVVGAAVAVLLLGGCGGAGGGVPAPGPSAAAPSSTASPRPQKPPLAFARTGVRLPSAGGTATGSPDRPLPVALHGEDAYLAGADSMQVLDTRDGRLLTTVRPRNTLLSGTSSAMTAPAPLVAAVGDSTLSLAMVAFLVTAPASAAKDAAPAGPAVELTAVDTSTLQTVWSTLIPGLPDWVSDGSVTGLAVAAVGVRGNTAVVRVTGDGVVGASFGLDLVKHRVAWHQDGFAAEVVTGDAVVGRTDTAVTALKVADGEQVWKQPYSGTVTVGPAAPGLVLVTGGGSSYLADTADGRRITLPLADGAPATCRYDEDSTLVCADHGAAGSRLTGFDAVTGKELWTLPDASSGSAAPTVTVTATWHGAVYGTAAAGPVVLDARTGAVRAASPGLAPVLLDGSVGLSAPSAAGAVTAHQASG